MTIETNLKKTFAKIYLKIYLGKKFSNDEFLFLNLVREEIKIIVLMVVTTEFAFILNKIKGNHCVEETTDLLFKLILTSAKNKILTKLKLGPPKSLQNTNLKKNWVLNIVGFENYAVFSVLVTSLSQMGPKTNTLQLVTLKLLIEHLIIKISDLLVKDIFLTKKIEFKLLTTYSIDELLLISYNTKMVTYLMWNIYIKSIKPATREMDVSTKILTFAKTGLTGRTMIIKKPYSNGKLSNFIINRPLKFLEGIGFSILQILAKE